MVTTNNHGLCYTNHSLTMEFEVKKINTNGNPFAKRKKHGYCTFAIIKSWLIFIREKYDSCSVLGFF